MQMTRSSASESTRASTRRTVASAGGRHAPVSGSRRTPSTARTGPGASAAHSPIAARDLAPASTAATAAPLARVGDLGEILEQVTALGERQGDGRVLLLGGGGNAL